MGGTLSHNLNLINTKYGKKINFEKMHFSGKGRQSICIHVMRIHKMLISYIKLDHTSYSINYGIPPPPDPSLTVDNVNRIMEKVDPKVKTLVWMNACGALMERDKIKEMCTSRKEDECADLYVNLQPSWEMLAQSLYYLDQVAAVEEVRSYLPPRGEPYYKCNLIIVQLRIGNYVLNKRGRAISKSRLPQLDIVVGCMECFCVIIIIVCEK